MWIINFVRQESNFMKKHFSIFAAALAVVMLAMTPTSCKKDGKGEKRFSPESMKDFYGTIWVANADLTYVLSFGDEVTLPRIYVLNPEGKISHQHILHLNDFGHPGQISFEIQDPTEMPGWGSSTDLYHTLKVTGDKSAVLYVCDEEWNHDDDGVPFMLSPDFDLVSLKFADAYVPKAVDLGEMKTSDGRDVHVKWAEWNLGACSFKVDGLFYCWGEFEQKAICVPSNYLYWDEPDVLPADKDAATIRLGAPWRMPTKDELEALFNTRQDATNFSWTYETRNDDKGWCVKRKTGSCAGNSIFLPLAGFCGSEGKDGLNEVAYFWSSSIDPKVYPHTPTISLDKRYAYFMRIWTDGGEAPLFDTTDRYCGLSIRPVCDL